MALADAQTRSAANDRTPAPGDYLERSAGSSLLATLTVNIASLSLGIGVSRSFPISPHRGPHRTTEQQPFPLHPLGRWLIRVAVCCCDPFSGDHIVQAQGGWAVGALGGDCDRLAAISEGPAYRGLLLGRDDGHTLAVSIEDDGA